MSLQLDPSASGGLQPLQKRSALACLPCRTAKNKCDGAPPPIIAELSAHLETKMPPPAGADVQLVSEHACTRCARLRLECLWQPSHRTGRPRKRARLADADDAASSLGPTGPVVTDPGSTASDGHLRQFGQIDHDSAARLSVADTADPTSPFGLTTAPSSSLLGYTGMDLIALLNHSQHDSSRAAIQLDLDHDLDLDLDLDLDQLGPQIALYDQITPTPLERSPYNPVSPLVITSLDQIHAPTCPQTSFSPSAGTDRDALLSTANDYASPSNTQQARSQFSALRARLNAVPRATSPSTTETKNVAPSSSLQADHIRAALQRYLERHDRSALSEDADTTAILEIGAHLYFAGFAKTVPVLGEASEFRTCVLDALPAQNGARSLLGRIIAVLGLSVASIDRLTAQSESSAVLDDLRSQARTLLAACLEGMSLKSDIPLDSVEALATLQALLLLAYDSYGNNRLAQAESDMRAAVDLARRMGLNRVDAPDSTGMSDGPHEQGAFHSRAAPLSAVRKESLRRLWWELYLCDLMLNVTTSGAIRRCLDSDHLEVAVHTPFDPGFADLRRSPPGGEGQSRQSLSQAYDIRIRTCALIHECVRQPEDPDEPDHERIRAIDTMLSNILIVAQRHWADASTQTESSSHQVDARPHMPTSDARADISRTRWALETRIELLFTAMTMLHASRIHLHRLAWFPDLTMDFVSCSFKRFDDSAGGVLSRAGPRSTDRGNAEQRQSMLSTSVTRIVSSADAIMRLVRLDQRMAVPAPWSDPGRGASDSQAHVPRGLPAHWPFLGCCNMVAAFGYVVAVAASGPEESNLPTYGDEIRLYGEHDVTGSENRGHGSVVAADTSALSAPSWQYGSPEASTLSNGGGNAGERQRSAMVWKLRAAISNIGFAESTLAQYSQVWPVCAMYQHEVAVCRDAIDSTGPTGLQ